MKPNEVLAASGIREMFRQFTSGDYVIGVDLADHPADRSVQTTFKLENGKLEMVDCSFIAVPYLTDEGKEKYFEEYESYLKQTVK